jgi:uncharacterized membrane protein
MDNRTLGIVATAVTAAVCGCAGLFACIFGIVGALQVPFQTTVNGVEGSTPIPSSIGYVLLCLSLILFVVPIVAGFIVLRKRPASIDAKGLPPTS